MKLSFLDSLKKLGYVVYADNNPILITKSGWGDWYVTLDVLTPEDVATQFLHDKSNEMVAFKLAMEALRQANSIQKGNQENV